MSLEYFYDNKSGSCRRTTTVIIELGLTPVYRPLELLKDEHKQPNLLSLNRTGMLPVLVDNRDDGSTAVISEAAAINIYLCENYQGTHLWPNGLERYQVLRWMSWAAEHFRVPAPMYFEENVIAPIIGNPPDQHRLQLAKHLVDKYGEQLNAHLAKKHYVVGDQFTLADIDLAAALSQESRSKIPYRHFRHIARWADFIEEHHASWKKTGELLQREMAAVLR